MLSDTLTGAVGYGAVRERAARSRDGFVFYFVGFFCRWVELTYCRAMRAGFALTKLSPSAIVFSSARGLMKILFVSSEGLPYSKTGGLADVIEGLPRALVGSGGTKIAVLLPRYRGNKVASVLFSGVTIPMGDQLRFPSIAEPKSAGRRAIFFRGRSGIFRPRRYLRRQWSGDYPDNAERFAEFSSVARTSLRSGCGCPTWFIATTGKRRWFPLMLRKQHANDPGVRSLPVVLTIHNLAYQGAFPRATMQKIGLPETLFTPDALEFYGGVNFLKGGLIFADYLTTVSPRYAKEIQTPEYGCGLDGVIRGRADRLTGILNGAEYTVWNPEKDSFIAQKYSARTLEGKKACKIDLLKSFHLPEENMDRPVVGIVSRFADQKGFDLIADVCDTLMQENIALVALGTGSVTYQDFFLKLAAKYPDRAAVKIGYDDALAHKIEAGADMFSDAVAL